MLSLILFLPALVHAANVGPVEIFSQRCQKAGEQVTCRVETSMDPTGAKYKLRLTGEVGSMSSMLTLLPLVQENRISVYFATEDLRSLDGNLLEGRFEKVVIQP